jgi:hypothetical protein
MQSSKQNKVPSSPGTVQQQVVVVVLLISAHQETSCRPHHLPSCHCHQQTQQVLQNRQLRPVAAAAAAAAVSYHLPRNPAPLAGLGCWQQQLLLQKELRQQQEQQQLLGLTLPAVVLPILSDTGGGG